MRVTEKDLRVEIRFKNNVLFQAIVDLGAFVNMAAFCRKFGFRQNEVGALLGLRINPLRKNGQYLKTCERLSILLGISCEDLFPARLYTHKEGTNLVVREISWEDAEAFLSEMAQEPEALPDEVYSRKELRKQITRVLSTLSGAEERVIKSLYGIEQPEQTLEEVALSFDLSTERIRQIELHAFGKLRRRTRRVQLEPFYS